MNVLRIKEQVKPDLKKVDMAAKTLYLSTSLLRDVNKVSEVGSWSKLFELLLTDYLHALKGDQPK